MCKKKKKTIAVKLKNNFFFLNQFNFPKLGDHVNKINPQVLLINITSFSLILKLSLII